MININTKKISKNIIPQIKKIILNVEECYEFSVKLKKSSHSSSKNINQIPTELISVKNTLKKCNNKLEEKISSVEKIESKKKYDLDKLSKVMITPTIKPVSNKTTLNTKSAISQAIITGCTFAGNTAISALNKIFVTKNPITKADKGSPTNFFKDPHYFIDQIKKLLKYKEEQLQKTKELAEADSQINTSGNFEELTDFQNVMISDLSLLELLYEGEEDKLAGKTIAQLYKESLTKIQPDTDYSNLVFNGNKMLDMSKEKNKELYRHQVLGKLVRYGFADLKIIKKVSGENGFDAFVLEDAAGNLMVYYPCTNLTEEEDYLYDSYPMMDDILDNTSFVTSVVGAKKIYKSQQKQAKELLESCIKENPGKKISVSGFSLGGSLAESSYLDAYKKSPNSLGEITLFNPYHNRLTKEDCEILKKDNKLNLYVSEGDAVSSVFNYKEFSDVAKPIYIDYKNNISEVTKNVDNNNSLLNTIVNDLKEEYCDKLISICNKYKKYSYLNFPVALLLKATTTSLEHIKKSNMNTVDLIKDFNQIVKKMSSILDKLGINMYETYNLDFLNNLQYVEAMFTSSHLTYSIDNYKEISFDENGNVKEVVSSDNGTHEVSYPSFDEVSVILFGSNPVEGISTMATDFHL